ncbi:tetratricopeptide repeat protein [Paractinoplanes durhamensis]|uniref:Tetratricopeptide repeat protein n=1 Tax=Paractinoplanes durhamensis TaxID=113563 RepID=A0ABQ3Z639_9ACTN|nr:tetratricopeptide repeat protein [Actinoplanes durhamensis]GIE05293.1 hypothetical protein Adu01nite_66430 [Actinoplanes durhamensis]
MKTADELWELLQQAVHLPYGQARIALLEQILRQVDQAGDADLAFTTRLMATTSYVHGGENVKSFVTFSWCVSDFDRNPNPYHERHMHTLLWQFKYMVNGLKQFPEIPLARTFAVLDDMERRYREGGHSMQVVHKHRYIVANHLGHADEADEWYARWQSTPRDSLSDCIGCDPDDTADYLNSRGRYAEVIELAEPVLAGELTCTEQPQGILRQLTQAYLHTGELEKAADAHRRSYRLERDNIANLWNIGSHIAFCARTGNEHRGLELLQRHIDWLAKAPSPSAEMHFAADSAMLLRRLTELGHGELTVRRQGQDEISVAELATEMADRAAAIAARFDARNGNDYQSRLIAEVIAEEPYGIDIPLSPTARKARPEKATPEPVAEVPAIASPAELLEIADEQFHQEQEAAMAATLDAIAERFGELSDPLLAARFAALTGTRLSAPDDDAGARKWDEAAALFEAAGAAGEASVQRARAALDRAHDGDVDPGPIRADVDHQEKHGGAAERANAWSRLSVLLTLQDEPAEAVEARNRADDYAAQTGDPRIIARHSALRARILANAEDNEGALAAARVAWDFYRAHGPADRLADVANLFGHLADDLLERVAAFTTAIGTGVAEEQLPARIGRGNVFKRLDRAGDAIDDLVEAVALCAEQDLTQGGAYARWELAGAYAMAGRPIEAAEVAEEALIVFDELGDGEMADNARFMLAKQYREIGDTAGAVNRYRELIERLAGNPAGRGQIGEEAGDLLFDLDRDAEAAEAFAAAGAALHEAGDLIGELRTLRRRVSALHYADEPEAATEAFGLAVERFAALPAELAAEPNAIWQHNLTRFEQSRVLMSRGRYAEALPIVRDAPARLRAIGATDDADHLDGMLGEALLRSGDPAAAEAHLRDLLAGMASDARGWELAEKIYQEAQEAARPEKS